MVFDGFWKDQPPLIPHVTPPLSLPKTDLLHGFRGSSFDRYPQARKELGLYMRPVGFRSGISFPYYSLEAKNCHGPPDVAVMQNAHVTALMLRNLWMLTTKDRQYNEEQPLSRDIERLVVLSSVLTPSYCTLDCHWLVPTEERPMFLKRRVKTWQFPEQFEDASRGMIGAIDWAHHNLETIVHGNLGRLEHQIQRESSTAANHGMSVPSSK